MVLFFDEFNRSIDPVTQTAIFQAISDNCFAGVTFPKGLIKVVLAGNPPDQLTGEAGEIETALVSRTIHWRKLGYTKQDAIDFLNFAWIRVQHQDNIGKISTLSLSSKEISSASLSELIREDNEPKEMRSSSAGRG